MKRLTYSLILASIVILLQAVFLADTSAGWFGSNESGWSDEDKRNFCHFLKSQQANNQAAVIINSMRTGYVADQQVSEILTLWRKALQEARQVTDSVLDKTHPELKNRYRNQYEQALQYEISSLKQENQSFSFSVNGFKMKDDFDDWFNSAKPNFRVPKGTVSACH